MSEYVSQQDLPMFRPGGQYASVQAELDGAAQLVSLGEVAPPAVVMDAQYVPAASQPNGQKIYAQTSTHTMSAKELKSLHEADLEAQMLALELPPCLVLHGVVGYAAFLNGTYHRIENASHEHRFDLGLDGKPTPY